jgi:hypothetical protein
MISYADALKELTSEKTPFPGDAEEVLRCYRCDGDRSPRVVKKGTILGMSKIKFDLTGDDTDLHRRILFTIRARLMGDDRVPELRGSHWTSIGFQNDKPWTDLRDTGMLSLLQLLYLCENHIKFVHKALSISQQPVPRGFPFACVSVNCTLLVFQHLRDDSDIADDDDTAVNYINTLHSACLNWIVSEWERKKYTIMEFQKIMSKLRTVLRKHPKRLLRKFGMK